MDFRPQQNVSTQRPPFPMAGGVIGPAGGGLLPTPPLQLGMPPPVLGGMIPVPTIPAPMPAPPVMPGAMPPAFPPVKSNLTSGAPSVPLPQSGLTPISSSTVPVSVASFATDLSMTNSNSTDNKDGSDASEKKIGGSNQDNVVQEQKSQLTTVFVGNITERASDALVRQILMKCGYIINWKRVQGANGRLQAFGFCEYSSPEAGLRAMRLLNGLELGEKILLVKVDSKTRAQLDEYKSIKRQEKQASGDDDDKEYDVEKDEETKNMDDTCSKEINSLLNQHSDVLSGKYEDSLPYMKKSHSGSADNLEGLDMDDARKNLVSKEIRMFRESYKDDGKDKDKKERERERDRERRDRERRDRERRDRDRDKDRDDRDRRRERDKDKDKRDGDDKGLDDDVSRSRHDIREKDFDDRMKYSDRDREKERDRDRDRGSSDKDKDRERDRDSNRKGMRDRVKEEDIDEEYERRRFERIKREREIVYLERLKEWEARERKKARDYEKAFAKEAKKKEEEDEERQHLQDFLEDYDDERDDPKYYRGTALARRMRDREIEVEGDSRDKQREMEEIEEILRRRMTETIGLKENESPNRPARREVDTIEKIDSPLQSINPTMKPTFSVVKTEPEESGSPSPSSRSSPPGIDSARNSPLIAGPTVPVKREGIKREFESVNDDTPVEPPAKKTTFGFGMKISSISQQNNKKLESVFNANDDDASSEAAPKKKLTRLDEEDDTGKQGKDKDPAQMTAEEKKKTIRNLIEKIPTGKDELFAYPLKWDMVDQPLVEKRIRPWINKKIFEYIGEEEPTLVEFICEKVVGRCSPKAILEDVQMVLDEEAEVFVVKMWRLLIYETDAKSLGLVK